jgi:hypothetical protein
MQSVDIVARNAGDVPEQVRGAAVVGGAVAGASGVVPKAWGWPIRVVGSSVLLETTSGFCGVEMRQRVGEAVLRLLAQAGSDGPVVRVMRPDPWLVFLAEADTIVEAETLQRTGAVVVQRGETIPLPPTNNGTYRASWAVVPRPDHRWLPALSTILWALRAATSRRLYV